MSLLHTHEEVHKEISWVLLFSNFDAIVVGNELKLHRFKTSDTANESIPTQLLG